MDDPPAHVLVNATLRSGNRRDRLVLFERMDEWEGSPFSDILPKSPWRLFQRLKTKYHPDVTMHVVERLDLFVQSNWGFLLEHLDKAQAQRLLADGKGNTFTLDPNSAVGRDLRSELYGDSPYPILKDKSSSSDMTLLRCQFLLERRNYRTSLRELHLMGGEGMMASWVTKMIPEVKEAQQRGEIPLFFNPEQLSMIAVRNSLGAMYARDRRPPKGRRRIVHSTPRLNAEVVIILSQMREQLNLELTCKTLGPAAQNRILDELRRSVQQFEQRGKSHTKIQRNLLRRWQVVVRHKSLHHDDLDCGAETKKLCDKLPPASIGKELLVLSAKLLCILLEVATVPICDAEDADEDMRAIAAAARKAHSQNARRNSFARTYTDASSADEEEYVYPCSLDGSGSDAESFVSCEAGQELPAFYHGLRCIGKRKRGYIYMSRTCQVARMRASDELPTLSLPTMLPTVCVPEKWRGPHDGAYLIHSPSFVCGIDLLDEEWGENEKVARCVDILGKTAWRINSDMLNVVKELPKYPIAVKSGVVPGESMPSGVLSPNERQAWASKCAQFHAGVRVAQDFANAKAIYFPHNRDFRGRTYPLPTNLHHQGNDVCRGLLQFADGKQLGDQGSYWYKVGAANLYGLGKITFEERVQWVDDNMQRIISCADQPLNDENIRWWSKASDGPLQFLARCFELAEFHRGSNLVSYLPVAMDGSCNGMQHYSALGSDSRGAMSVNISPSEIVQDVYVEVLKEVREVIEADLSCAEKKECAQLALQVLCQKGRKVVKRTVMTVPYGVTTGGATEQVEEQLCKQKSCPREEQKKLARYIAPIILKSTRAVFVEAMDIQTWLGKFARMFTKHNIPVTWAAQHGFMVKQPYFADRVIQVETELQFVSMKVKSGNKSKVDGKRQHASFPPNYIHSLDAAHMMFVAEACDKMKITFASVHDSFWTHACDIPRLNRVLREKFQDMYSKNHLAKLRDTTLTRFKNFDKSEVPPLPQRGDLDLQGVLQSKYFFH